MRMMSPAMTALMTATMMVAMMLPSVAPTLWRYHHILHSTRTKGAGRRTTLFAAGYASVWAGIGVALFALNAVLSPFAPWTLGTVVLCVGTVQRSRWKAKQLLRCRDACVITTSKHAIAPWRDGCRLGADCALSCAAPMAVLFAAGLMDERVMLLISAAITAERVPPGGLRIARLTGAVALIAGLLMCVGACLTIAIPVW